MKTLSQYIKESIRRLLTQYIAEGLLLVESQESKSIDAAKKLVMDKFGWDRSRADSFVRNDLRQEPY